MRSSADGSRGNIRLEFLLAGIVLSLLFGVFLVKFADLQRDIEMTLIDSEVSGLRAELQMEAAGMISRGRDGELRAWIARNPLAFLPSRKAGSDGQAVKAPAVVRWQWDEDRRQLVYQFSGGGRIRLELAAGPLGGRDGWVIGGGVVMLRWRDKN